MIFDALLESANKNELILIDGGFCRWHMRRDNKITIYEIISIKKGSGGKMLNILINKNPTSIIARCPKKLNSNEWYKKMGFSKIGENDTINIWELCIQNQY